MLIDILLLASSEVILTPDGQSVKTTVRRPQFGDHSSDTVQTLASIYAVASAARAASFKSATLPLPPYQIMKG